MKRFLTAFAVSLVAVFTPLSASAASPPRVQGWDMRGSYVIDFQCTTGCGGVPHYVSITQQNFISGYFSGSGYYQPNPSFTWNVSGQLDGSAISTRILYTGNGAGYYVDLVGSVAPNGTLSGTAVDASGDLFNWHTTSGAATMTAFENHGQFVSQQTDKALAARTLFGKPNSSL